MNNSIIKQSDISLFLLKILKNWYLFAICITLFCVLGYIYTIFATKEYLVTSKILIEDQGQNK